MKRLLPLLFVICLLSGCAAGRSGSTAAAVEETAPDVPVSLYLPDSPMETATQGAVQTYGLPIPDPYGLLPTQDGLLLFSGKDTTTLTKLSGDGLYITASADLSCRIHPDDVSLHLGEQGLSFFDPQAGETVLLDASLTPTKRIAAPEDLAGTPVLSRDGNTLYYCTANSLRAWDLSSGIRRMVKEMAFPSQEVIALHMDGTLVQCRVTDESGAMRSLFLSGENGKLLQEKAGEITLSAGEEGYHAAFREGIAHILLFGTPTQSPSFLIPDDLEAQIFPLENCHAAVTCSLLSEEVILDYYDLNTGLRQSRLSLKASAAPLSIAADDAGFLWLLAWDAALEQPVLYRWDASQMRLNDSHIYTAAYHTAADPDYSGLAQCQAYADKIGETYGIEIGIWLDALEVTPWDYQVEAEHMVPVILRELTRLETALSVFPEGFLETAVSNFSGLRISLVRSLTGTGGVDSANGVQFFDGTDAHILLTPGAKLEQSLYHELYHVMETQILNESIALDQWDKLNPSGFAYDYDYSANARRDGSAYLQTGTRAFIDTYSMSFPKEDRARILEYAMTPNHASLFQSPQMQAKLSQLCLGIREAYGLEKAEEAFLWEQYLTTSPHS